MSREEITLSSLQHFVYCPHEWGLMAIGGEWDENAFTVNGHLFHEHVHDARADESRAGKFSVRGMPLYDERLGLVGVADLVEFREIKQGGYLAENGRRYRPCAVEYKVGKPETSDSIRDGDRMQLTAQMVCLEGMLGCECDGYVYYKRTNRRIRLTDFSEAKVELERTVERMRRYLSENRIPEERSRDGCGGCSLKDICLPKTKTQNVFSAIDRIWENER